MAHLLKLENTLNIITGTLRDVIKIISTSREIFKPNAMSISKSDNAAQTCLKRSITNHISKSDNAAQTCLKGSITNHISKSDNAAQTYLKGSITNHSRASANIKIGALTTHLII
jgi:hemerythrin